MTTGENQRDTLYTLLTKTLLRQFIAKDTTSTRYPEKSGRNVNLAGRGKMKYLQQLSQQIAAVIRIYWKLRQGQIRYQKIQDDFPTDKSSSSAYPPGFNHAKNLRNLEHQEGYLQDKLEKAVEHLLKTIKEWRYYL